jgi:hypothetical protein
MLRVETRARQTPSGGVGAVGLLVVVADAGPSLLGLPTATGADAALAAAWGCSGCSPFHSMPQSSPLGWGLPVATATAGEVTEADDTERRLGEKGLGVFCCV